MPIYGLNDVPETITWINALTAQQAVAQCSAWNISSAPTLEENRIILKSFVRTHNEENLQHDDPPNLNDQSPATNAERAVTTQTETTTFSAVTTTTTTLTTATPLTKTTMTTATPYSPTPILDPNVQALIQSLQTMTLNAVAQTASTLTEQIKSIQSQSQSESTNCPTYVRELLKELPRISGADTRELVSFLKKLHQIMQLNLVKDKYIILNIVPYTTNRFREFWMTAIAQNLTWSQTLDSIRENFFTSDTLRELQNQNLYRRQRQQEHLADFVKDIQTLHTILSPNTLEPEVFQTIFRGINQQTRTTFAGLKPINSIQDLLDVAPLSTSLLNQPAPNSQINQSPSTSRNQYYSNPPFRQNRDSYFNTYQHRQANRQTSYPQQRYQAQQIPTQYQYSPLNQYQSNATPSNFRPQYQQPGNPNQGYRHQNFPPRNANSNQHFRYTHSDPRTNQRSPSNARPNLNYPRGGY